MRQSIKVFLGSAVLAVLSAWVVAVPASAADFGFKELGFSFTDEAEEPSMQAGSHPFAVNTRLMVNTEIDPKLGEIPVDAIKQLRIDLPPGMVGAPKATPRCTGAEFVDINQELKLPSCSDDTAIGVVALAIGESKPEFQGAPVYNLVPPPGVAAQIGFIALGVPVTIDLRVNEQPPYNVIAELKNVAQAVRLYGSVVSVWGNPASPEHDAFRGSCVDAITTTPGLEIISKGECDTDAPEKPFITAPRTCVGPVSASFEGFSWEEPLTPVFGSATTEDSSGPVGFSECESLEFGPTISTQPTSQSAESPTGLDVEVNVQDEGLVDPQERAHSDIQKAEVRLPAGMTINPSQAAGLGACSEADVARETASSERYVGCPESSNVGTVEVETPLLEGEVLKGELFVATPFENPVGSLIALYMVIKNKDLGIALKLPGKVALDPKTGQLVSTFDNLPQLPFSHFHLRFRGGERSPLSTPSRCGKYTTEAVFTPSGNPSETFKTTSSFEVTSGPGGSPCPTSNPFGPGLTAGTSSNSAGSFSPFLMRLTRNDGEQELTRFAATLPPGVVGKVAGVPQCSQASIDSAKGKSGRQEIASPSCPAASQVGSVLAGAGVGPALTFVPGNLYLGGPYKGAPLSVASIVPAVAGPFDLGTVVVQVGLNLNPITAQVEVGGATSDPIPHILQGVPLELRDLRIKVDRPDFTLNATSCNRFATQATFWGGGLDLFTPDDDVQASASDAYQAADCSRLGFKPKLKMTLKGGTKRTAHPALRAVLTPRPGDANIGRAVVLLPRSEFIDQNHISNPCTRVQFNANECPPGSVLGVARATTPLLEQPLEGPVYFRSNGGERQLPDIVADLKGLFRVTLVGFVDSKNRRIRTTFAAPPDAPVSKFEIRLKGGKKGLLVNSENLCAKKRTVKLALTGQNGLQTVSNPVIGTSCKKKKKPRRR